MKLKKQSSKKKILIIVSLSILIAIIMISFATYLKIHSYINKMNLVTAEESTNETLTENLHLIAGKDIETNVELNIPPDQEISDTPDSPAQEIQTVEEELRENMEENQTQIMQDKNVFNILLIGSDTRESGDRGRSDAMIIVSINKKTKTITATSILRDTYVSIPGKKSNRINAAYAFGGSKLLLETIEQNFKIKIDKYVSVDFFAFIDVVDAIGGVTLEVSEKEIPVINEYIAEINRLSDKEETLDQLSASGTLLLSGKQALGYSRNRYVGNSDFERTARQRRVLEQIFKKVKDLNLVQLDKLLNTILPQVTTNLSEGEIFSLILSLPTYARYDLQQWSIPTSKSYKDLRIRGMEVLGIDFGENINQIKIRIYGEQTE